MKFEIENLKRRAQQLAEETRQKSISPERIGKLCFDIIGEIDTLYKYINRRNFLLCYTSIVIALTSLILSILKSDDISVDGANMLGVIVGVLGFLVTLLIGFQIYKALEVEEVIDNKINAIESRMYESLKTYSDVQIDKKLDNK